MRFTLTIDSDNIAATDMGDLGIILDKVLGRIINMRNNGNDLDGSVYSVLDANGNTVGTFTGMVEAWDEDDLLLQQWADDEPDLSAEFEFDSAMESVGWGTDESYGYYGDDYY